MLLLASVLVASSGLVGDPSGSVIDDTIRVSITVQYEDDESFQSQLLSYFRRELRGMGDVVVVDQGANIEISALGLPVAIGSSRRGHALSVAVHGRCTAPIDRVTEQLTRSEADDSATAASKLGATLEWLLYVAQCRQSLTQRMFVWNTETDVLQRVRSIVAEIDTEYIEPLRGG